ncbi:hypothetical protein [Streptomyces violaceusniger]|uniref:Uncharacterized protein n=1 Tax=Streptomyces violaceusniger (strain Tu 4113) TaxID=653045 RepID=G2PHM7_STRV4|nr:hypothetical protein [Streptomyces violaceusniger]AEM88828.1 hypothetical protein Strvi_0051 [Streptomyces violaceusniger Tu 4113]
MRTSIAAAAMFVHDKGIQSPETSLFLHEHAVTLLAAGGSGGFISAVGRLGAFGLTLVLLVLTKGLVSSGKANGKPWILVLLGLMIAGSFAYAGGFLEDLNGMALEFTNMINDLGLGEATPSAIGVCVALVLWLFPLKPMHRIFWGFMGYVTWSAADGSLFKNIGDLVDHLVQRFAG